MRECRYVLSMERGDGCLRGDSEGSVIPQGEMCIDMVYRHTARLHRSLRPHPEETYNLPGGMESKKPLPFESVGCGVLTPFPRGCFLPLNAAGARQLLIVLAVPYT